MKATKATPYEQAVALLASPQTWCKGAQALARLGDRRALLPLLDAYESPVEAGKGCLLEAMEKLGAREAAAGIYEAKSPDRRWQALRLMELFESDRHLPHLQRALSDPDPSVRAQAREALLNQERTSAWKRAIAQVLKTTDPQTRAKIETALKVW